MLHTVMADLGTKTQNKTLDNTKRSEMEYRRLKNRFYLSH